MASRKDSVSVAGAGMTSTGGTLDSPVKQVQIDGLVVLKIIKHYQEEGQGSEVVQGVLLGLVVDDRLEITNCFPFPQHTEDDADFDEVQYQMEMMRSLRHVNIDHLHVGWYQSTFYGSFVSRALLDSQFSYQHAIEESVVLIYDPIKTAQGSLSLKAYRLTPKLMEICKEKDFTPEGLKKANIGFEHMFEEVPIVIKNSHLINVLMWELEDKSTVADKHELLSLSSSNHLEKSLQLLMDRVDDMSQEIVKYNTYSRNLSKQQQQKHQPPCPSTNAHPFLCVPPISTFSGGSRKTSNGKAEGSPRCLRRTLPKCSSPPRLHHAWIHFLLQGKLTTTART
ncbi:eukaryotic translation initiation factor 3 subunit H isoform X2 [Channa argus]|uniref:eukaryotic translation initiation factor 3 subunit H isoform X2 n=1 Tax=Channa argus TaxID=215402 RepID=UPI00352083B8